jgi:hypothetical protein
MPCHEQQLLWLYCVAVDVCYKQITLGASACPAGTHVAGIIGARNNGAGEHSAAHSNLLASAATRLALVVACVLCCALRMLHTHTTSDR